MSFFRTPSYLDLGTLTALADSHGIEVAPDTEVTTRDLGQRSRGASANVNIPVVTSFQAGISGSKGTESELIQKQTIKAHPTKTLNQVLDQLHRDDSITTDVIKNGASKGQVVEIDEDWVISSATDTGHLVNKIIEPLMANPSLLDGGQAPNEVIASVMTSEITSGPIILEYEHPHPESNVIVILNAENILEGYSSDDLEGDLTIFGTVQRTLGVNRTFSLERYFLPKISRVARRAIDLKQMLRDSPLEVSSLEIPGPVIVVRAIAIY